MSCYSALKLSKSKESVTPCKTSLRVDSIDFQYYIRKWENRILILHPDKENVMSHSRDGVWGPHSCLVSVCCLSFQRSANGEQYTFNIPTLFREETVLVSVKIVRITLGKRTSRIRISTDSVWVLFWFCKFVGRSAWYRVILLPRPSEFCPVALTDSGFCIIQTT